MAFAAIVVGLVVYLGAVGLDRADKLASAIGMVVALVALVAPYLLPAPRPRGAPRGEPDRAQETGAARATGGGWVNTGVDGVGADRAAEVDRSGDATADGPGSVANTGVRHRRLP